MSTRPSQVELAVHEASEIPPRSRMYMLIGVLLTGGLIAIGAATIDTSPPPPPMALSPSPSPPLRKSISASSTLAPTLAPTLPSILAPTLAPTLARSPTAVETATIVVLSSPTYGNKSVDVHRFPEWLTLAADGVVSTLLPSDDAKQAFTVSFPPYVNEYAYGNTTANALRIQLCGGSLVGATLDEFVISATGDAVWASKSDWNLIGTFQIPMCATPTAGQVIETATIFFSPDKSYVYVERLFDTIDIYNGDGTVTTLLSDNDKQVFAVNYTNTPVTTSYGEYGSVTTTGLQVRLCGNSLFGAARETYVTEATGSVAALVAVDEWFVLGYYGNFNSTCP